MEPVIPGRCSIHDLASGPDGRCALCNRLDARAAEPKVGTNQLVIGGLAVLALAVAGAVAVKGLRGTPGAVPRESAEQAGGTADAKTASVRLFTTSWCPHCSRAKKWLAAQHVEYVELDVEHDASARREHRRLNPRGSVPTFDADGEVVQGFSPEGYQAALQRSAGRQGRP